MKNGFKDYFNDIFLLLKWEKKNRHIVYIYCCFLFTAVTAVGIFILSSQEFSFETTIIAGGLVHLVLIISPVFFGQIGAVVSVALFLTGSIMVTVVLRNTPSEYYYAVRVFQLSGVVTILIINRLVVRIKNYIKELSSDIYRDGLTNLYNRRLFDERLYHEWSRAKRYNLSIALAIIDIDNFKQINDGKGHLFGDEVIRNISEIIRESVRTIDLPCRYGGDEFAVILPNTDAARLKTVFERLQKNITAGTKKLSEQNPITVSIGGGVSGPILHCGIKELIDHADQALYRIKKSRKNGYYIYNDIIRNISFNTSKRTADMVHNIQSLLLKISAKDNYTYDHCLRVCRYVKSICDHKNLNGKTSQAYCIAALVHDVGKISINEELLNKTSSLMEKEWEILYRHTETAKNIMCGYIDDEEVIESVLHHHERYEGGGYPAGLEENEIPPGARILAVADAFDALQSDRPYRPKYDILTSIDIIVESSGKQFDPELVETLISIYK